MDLSVFLRRWGNQVLSLGRTPPTIYIDRGLKVS